MLPFKNEVVYDFSNQEYFNKQKDALDFVKSNLGKEYPNYIGSEQIKTDKKTNSYSPADKDLLIGIFQKSGREDAEKAIQTAAATFETWKYETPEKRANILFKAAEIVRRRRFEINAWMILEAGKNFTEADADTCEAIDFLDFYGREALRYAKNQELTGDLNEINSYFYIPLGVGIVIPPWNFPFAILVGMTSASLVTGNTVVLKPSSETPMMGHLFMEVLQEAGLPDGVVNFLVASGSEAGDYLVDHHKTRFISFTGSMAVGTRIYERASKVNEGQIWLKRVVAEMGGKDAIIVDCEYEDLDFAAQQIVAAAFGFQGQKCSACSRLIIDEKIYDELLEKVVALTNKLEIGLPWENKQMGPVISQSAYNDILGYIKKGSEQGKLRAGGEIAEGNGWFIKPTIIESNENDIIAKEEIFGPVLSVIKSKDFDHSVKIFNDTIYGLTGALFTNNESKLERGYKDLHCGNLYLNRKCTGALVDVHPFGGFNMSGTDSKAGSRDYLMLFLQGKSVARKK